MKKNESGEVEKGIKEQVPKKEPDQESSEDSQMMVACARLSSERYRAFIENIGEGVYEVDIHGNFLYFNNSLCRIFGYSREEIQFQNFAKFMDEEHGQKAFKTFNRIYETGQGISNLLWPIIDKERNVRYIELSANLITNQEGKKIGFRGIARDITERFKTQEELRKSERRYRTLLDFVPYPIVVFTLDGLVSYLNPAFTDIFGWTLAELEGKNIPYVPAGLEQETSANIRRLFEEKIILRHETRRLTKDGRILDVVMRAAVYSESEDEPSGEIVILRDITQEKRIQRNNDAMLRISMALPEHPDLKGLLDYISEEVKDLLGTEGALVILLDEESHEFYFEGAAHDDSATEKRVKQIRFPAENGIAGRVLRTGEPEIVMNPAEDPDYDTVVDREAGFRTTSLLDVPLKSKERTIGVLCAINKKTGAFDQTDVELLSMIAGTVALSIENAKFAKELKEAYQEVTSLNRAKDRVINHLSHELKTPLAVLSASLNILAKKLSPVPRETWMPTIERAERNLERVLEMQYQVEDIMREKEYKSYQMLSWLLDECADELQSLIAEQVGEGNAVERIRKRIDEIFGPKEEQAEEIRVHEFVPGVLKEIRPLFSHRVLSVEERFEEVPAIRIPKSTLRKVVEGLIKNAVENTPDGGKIEISVKKRGRGAELVVMDYGVGITPDNQRRIFEGFFATQETLDYSSKRPYDFNAGGKGSDLLRMKIFSERYGFKIAMVSTRCVYIPQDSDQCPGNIQWCDFCNIQDDCLNSGGTTFRVFFPGGAFGEPLHPGES
ncbi:MAG: PAS domain S-box protein [Deltaproteobacteria bacterium]|nr:PAS domain S-box protein [Deltaproteobacteria bacterium]